MKSFLKSLLTVAVCLFLGGSHFAVLQLVAWTGMIVTYSAKDGLAAGVKDTFSGAKPCPMCKAIRSAQKAETDETKNAPAPGATALAKLAKEMLAGQTLSGFTLTPTSAKQPDFPMPGSFPARGEQPPVPPPRSLA